MLQDITIPDQRGLNSCAAITFCDMIARETNRIEGREIHLSSLFLYYNARKLLGASAQNVGLSFEEVEQAYIQYGVCEEAFWEYDPDYYYQQPPEAAYGNTDQISRIATEAVNPCLQEIKNHLQEGRYLFVGLRFDQYDFYSFNKGEISKTGLLNHRLEYQETTHNHAVLLMNYNQRRNTFLARNSLGVRWGKRGYFEIEPSILRDEKTSFSLYTIKSKLE